jgi:exodeoxyribonuclease V alpha subunit
LANNQVSLPTTEVKGFSHLLQHRYVVLTGAAKSGKTTMIRELASACRAAGWRVAVTAMTGKAASVIGPEAKTLHRLLGFSPHGYPKELLPYDLVIIDEVSMLTWPLLAAALRVIPGHIVFCGDPRQLPPVEGEPAFPELLRLLPVHDLGVVPAVQFTTVRHWSTEHLLLNLERVCRTCRDAGQEWQVLSPVKSSRLGTIQLNQFLQRVINPHGLPVGDGFRVGDRIIVVRNDYAGSQPVYNGQMGIVLGAGERGIHVRLENNHEVDVAPRDLELAYCLTVHKAQGSRFDIVVFVIPSIAKDFAENAHMQYVGLTRGRQATWCYAL